MIAIQATPLSTRVASAATKLGTRMITASAAGVEQPGGEQDPVRGQGFDSSEYEGAEDGAGPEGSEEEAEAVGSLPECWLAMSGNSAHSAMAGTTNMIARSMIRRMTGSARRSGLRREGPAQSFSARHPEVVRRQASSAMAKTITETAFKAKTTEHRRGAR